MGPAILQCFIQHNDQNNLYEKNAVPKAQVRTPVEASWNDKLITEFETDGSTLWINQGKLHSYQEPVGGSWQEQALHNVHKDSFLRTGHTIT